MNTEVRRNIFCVIMTSEDYLDAFEKLLRFVMKRICTRQAAPLTESLPGRSFKAFHRLSAQDGPEGQAGEGDSSCSYGLLPAGENL